MKTSIRPGRPNGRTRDIGNAGGGLVIVAGCILAAVPPLAEAAPQASFHAMTHTPADCVFIENGKAMNLVEDRAETGGAKPGKWTRLDRWLQSHENANTIFAGKSLAKGDFHVSARLAIDHLEKNDAYLHVPEAIWSLRFRDGDGSLRISDFRASGRLDDIPSQDQLPQIPVFTGVEDNPDGSSSDDGNTWAEPTEITKDVQRGWGWYATGPGVGIQLKRGQHKGRLVIPCNHKPSHVFYSDDHGKSWKLGGNAAKGTDESQVVELVDGSLMLNCRSGARREVFLSKDGGDSFERYSTQELVLGGCQASILRYSTQENGGKNRLLFSNPFSPGLRTLL